MTSPQPQQSHDDPQAAAVEEIVRAGPAGAFALAGLATALVMAMYVAFYVVVFLPRGAVQ